MNRKEYAAYAQGVADTLDELKKAQKDGTEQGSRYWDKRGHTGPPGATASSELTCSHDFYTASRIVWQAAYDQAKAKAQAELRRLCDGSDT